MKRGIFILLFIVLASSVYAETTTVKLLTVNEAVSSGSVAELTLETKDGTGRVFIEANLLSNEDTQFSIRMAKEIVCKNYNFNCDNYDFYYTIDAATSFVTGPSGGAGIALLTYANLDGQAIPEDISITGTINSGGFVGNVGGVKEKISAAKRNGLSKVYIPFGNRFVAEEEIVLNNSNITIVNETIINNSNITVKKIDLIEFGNILDIEVIEVGIIDEVLEDLLGKEIEDTKFELPQFYVETMSDVSEGICNRARNLISTLDVSNINLNKLEQKYYWGNDTNVTLPKISESKFTYYSNISNHLERATDLINYSNLATKEKDHYSSASYCFSALLRLRYLQFIEIDNVSILIEEALRELQYLKAKNITSLGDLQVSSVVGERLKDAQKAYDEALELDKGGEFFESIDRYAYSYERAFTAESWSIFYGTDPNEIHIDEVALSKACDLTIQEAEERIDYIKLYLTIDFASEETLKDAKDARMQTQYPDCIFYALSAKAEIDALTSAYAADEEDLERLLNVKQKITERIISNQANKGHFPILGYSYLEYGNSLRETEGVSTLLYYQLAQEISNLDLFFNNDPTPEKVYYNRLFWIAIPALIFGVLILHFIER